MSIPFLPKTVISICLILFLFHPYGSKGKRGDEKVSNRPDSVEIAGYLELAKNFKAENQIDSSIIYAERAAFRSLKASNYYLYCNSLLTLSSSLIVKAAYEEADSVVRVVENTISKNSIQDKELLSILLQRKGLITFYVEGDHQKTLKKYYKSLNIRRENNILEDGFTSDLLDFIGYIHTKSGAFDSAEYYLFRSLELRKRIYPPNHSKVGDLYYSLGRLFQVKGDYPASLEYARLCLEVAKSNYDLPDSRLARPYIGMGIANLNIGNNLGALKYFEKAIVITNLSDKKTIEEAHAYYAFGELYRLLGEYNLSVQNLLKSIAIYKKVFPSDHAVLIWVYNALGDSYSYINTDKAIEALSEGLRITNAQEHYVELEKISILNGIVSTYFENGNYIEAEKKLDEAIDFLHNSGLKRQDEELRTYILGISIMIALKNFEAAERFVTKANRELAYSSEPVEKYRVGVHYAHSKLNYYQQEFDSCIYYADLSLKVNTGISANSTLGDLIATDWQSYFEALNIKGESFYHLYLQSGEIEYLLKMDSVFSYFADSYDFYFEKLGFSQDKLNSLELNRRASDFLMLSNDALFNITKNEIYKKRMLELSNRSKSYSLEIHLDQLFKSGQRLIPDSLKDYESELKSKISYYENGLLLINDSIEYSRKLNDLLFTKEKFSILRTKLETHYPEYYLIKYRDEEVNMEMIRNNLLLDNQAIIDYSLLDSILFVSVLTKTKFEIKKVNVDDTLTNAIKDYNVNLIKSVKESGVKDGDWEYLSSKLYDILISPVETHLQGINSLVIIPDDILALIPYETLLSTSDSTKTSISSEGLLLSKYKISYANSLELLGRNYSSNTLKNSDNKILAYAPSFSQSIVANDVKLDSVRSGLNPLNWTEQEVKSVSEQFNSDILVREEATEASFRKRVSDYDIIHLATHGLIDDEEPMLSKLVFSFDEKDTIHDGYIHTQELFGMDIPAEMAVLSACNTGYGKVIEGEGVLSLARGFFYAGAKSVVMSLWPANDKSTATIMESFYKYLAEGKRKDEALRQAKLDYLATADEVRSHPYYWAQFVANGNMRPIVYKNQVWMIYQIIMLIVSILTIFLLFRQKKSTY